MIITRINGGLGNQMFQYACGLALAEHWGTSLVLHPLTRATDSAHNGFELQRIFKVPEPLADEALIESLLGWRASRWGESVLRRVRLPTLLGSFNYVQEPHFQYFDLRHHATPNSYLNGYWQSEKYFFEIDNTLRLRFVFPALSSANVDVVDAIRAAGTSVSVHVRRGDYVTNQKTEKHHGTCSLDYYRAAVSMLIQRYPSSRFFIFSDDPEWTRVHIPIPAERATYIAHNNGVDSYQDMQLMSLCAHHIIANSSFSWWGAWLNPSRQKTVIAPQQWFRANLDTRDLYPSSWCKV